MGGERTHIGRYQITARLGAGGMGEVWQATDPQLGRVVAIKVLHGGGMQLRLAERLRREAQALAKLEHPNVVTVHDVGVDDDGELYIVMQLVAGTTLDRAVAGKSAKEIVALLVQAGRGLAAAHAAGIVHRDFKPTNVFVDHAGRVRVGDFGLARASEASDEQGDADAGELGVSMSRGELVGTPAYMAPEQLRGGPVTAATDQFAFCVTTWEMLSGQRPFAGSDVAALREAVAAGPPGKPPATIPRRLRAVLARGLSVDPAARFPSMDALLAELEPGHRGLWVAGGVAIAGLATTAVLLAVARPESDDPCRGVDEPADAVWGDAQRAAVRGSLGAFAPPVIALLDERTARWRERRLDACQATYADSDPQSLDERDLRYACLDQSLVDQRAAVALLSVKPDARMLGRLTQVASSGRDAAECTREVASDRIAAGQARRLDPALQIEVAAASALREAERFDELFARRDRLEPRIIASGDHEAIWHWFSAISYAYKQRGDLSKAREPMRRAAEAALAARRDDLAARAWAELAVLTARASDLKGSDDLIAMARGAAARSEEPVTGVWIELALGQIALERGDHEKAVTSCEAALAAAKAIGVARKFEAAAMGCVYDAKLEKGDFEGALATAKTRLARAVEYWGPDSPADHALHRSLATAYSRLGKDAEALAAWRKAIEGVERQYGPDSIDVMWMLKDFAIAQTPAGTSSTPEALAAIRRAVTIAESSFKANDPQRGQIYETHAFVLKGLKQYDESIASYDKAIAIYEKHDDPMVLAKNLYNAADILKRQNRCDRALPRFERAAKVAARTSVGKVIEAAALYARGACLGLEKKWDEADPVLRQSIEQLDQQPGRHLFAAQARFELAQQLAKRGRAAEGVTIAKAAVAQLAGKPPPADAIAKEIEGWIKQHAPR